MIKQRLCDIKHSDFYHFLYQNAIDLHPLLIFILEFVIKLKTPNDDFLDWKQISKRKCNFNAREVDIFEVGSAKVQ